MITEAHPSTRAVGFWSAVLATFLGISYDIGQLAEWIGLMGSGGGNRGAVCSSWREESMRVRGMAHRRSEAG